MHHSLTALLAERYHPWVRWEMGTHAPPDHEDVPHLGGGTGDGWFDLQERLFRCWSTRNERWVLVQVKEKFAELTVYADPELGQQEPNWRFGQYVAIASQRVCEQCGAPGRRAQGGGWFSTVCERHRSFQVQDRDAAERDACPTAAAVQACLAAQRIRPPEADVPPDLEWAPVVAAPRSLGQRMQALDTAITWLQELDRPLLQPADLETILDPHTLAALEVPWISTGLPRVMVTKLCHAALRAAEVERHVDGCRTHPCIIHLPEMVVLLR